MQYFLDKKGPADYIPTQQDIDETKLHSRSKVLDEIYLAARKGSGFPLLRPGRYNIQITHPGKGSEQSSNIRWWYWNDDKHMLYAFGGADLNVTGFVRVSQTYKTERFLLSSRVVPDKWYWWGRVQVSLGDEYTFESRSMIKTSVSAIVSETYDAALWLESNCGYTAFYHKMDFSLSWNMEGPPDIHQKIVQAAKEALGTVY